MILAELKNTCIKWSVSANYNPKYTLYFLDRNKRAYDKLHKDKYNKKYNTRNKIMTPSGFRASGSNTHKPVTHLSAKQFVNLSDKATDDIKEADKLTAEASVLQNKVNIIDNTVKTALANHDVAKLNQIEAVKGQKLGAYQNEITHDLSTAHIDIKQANKIQSNLTNDHVGGELKDLSEDELASLHTQQGLDYKTAARDKLTVSADKSHIESLQDSIASDSKRSRLSFTGLLSRARNKLRRDEALNQQAANQAYHLGGIMSGNNSGGVSATTHSPSSGSNSTQNHVHPTDHDKDKLHNEGLGDHDKHGQLSGSGATPGNSTEHHVLPTDHDKDKLHNEGLGDHDKHGQLSGANTPSGDPATGSHTSGSTQDKQGTKDPGGVNKPNSLNPSTAMHIAPASPGSDQPGLGMAVGTTPTSYNNATPDSHSNALVEPVNNLGGQRVEDLMAHYQETWPEFKADNKALVDKYGLGDTPNSIIPHDVGSVFIRADKVQSAVTAPVAPPPPPVGSVASPNPSTPATTPPPVAASAPVITPPILGVAPGMTEASYPGAHLDKTSGALVETEVAPGNVQVQDLLKNSLAPKGENWDEFSADNTEYKSDGTIKQGMSIEVRADRASGFEWPKTSAYPSNTGGGDSGNSSNTTSTGGAVIPSPDPTVPPTQADSHKRPSVKPRRLGP